MVYATTGNSYSDPPSEGANAFIAFRLDDGSRAWVRQTIANDAYTMACNPAAGGSGNCPQANGPDVDFGSSAMLVTLPGGRRAIPGVVFSGGFDGHLRAYDAVSGRIVRDVDTKRPYDTVNGVAARGGSLDGPGAVVVDGMLYVNSGMRSSAARLATCCWPFRSVASSQPYGVRAVHGCAEPCVERRWFEGPIADARV